VQVTNQHKLVVWAQVCSLVHTDSDMSPVCWHSCHEHTDPPDDTRPRLDARTDIHTHTYRFLSGCEEVENGTSQLAETRNFPQPHNTTLLHEFYLTTTQMLEYTPTQCLLTRLPHGLVR